MYLLTGVWVHKVRKHGRLQKVDRSLFGIQYENARFGYISEHLTESEAAFPRYLKEAAQFVEDALLNWQGCSMDPPTTPKQIESVRCYLLPHEAMSEMQKDPMYKKPIRQLDQKSPYTVVPRRQGSKANLARSCSAE